MRLLKGTKIGPGLSLVLMLLLFVVPVYAAYAFASSAQPYLESSVIQPLRYSFREIPAFFQTLLTGNYGLFTLLPYSFLWAFPVVLFTGMSLALSETTGIKTMLIRGLDPWIRKIGLNGHDLVPILSGFGCNVVGVLHSRGCSTCSRKSCVSFITLGSACSYQIGATLSLFGSSGHPTLFLPYLFILSLVGAVHTRIWHGAAKRGHEYVLPAASTLRKPVGKQMYNRVYLLVKQFVTEAMPVFLLICVIASIMEYTGFIEKVSILLEPVLGALGLPKQAAPGLLFSIIRKDGMLAFNQGNGTFLASLSVPQLFLLVYLASTFSACLVTLWTIYKELGKREALFLAGRQAATSLVSTGIVALMFLID